MLLAVGTKVRLKHTGDLGEVTRLLEDDMVIVRLQADNMEIPIFIDDLVNAEDEQKKVTKAKRIEKSKPERPDKPIEYQVDTQYQILKSAGIQLAFNAVHGPDDLVKYYEIYLINDTIYDVIFSFNLDLEYQTPRNIHGKISHHSTYDLGKLLYDELNDAPIVTLECRQVTTAGTGKAHFKEIRIKPKQFFKKVLTAPFLNKPVHLYKFFESFDVPEIEPEEDLKSYTQKNKKPTFRKKEYYSNVNKINVEEFANFPSEIDLHIENLTSNSKKMTNGQKLQLQLDHFEEYIRKAVNLGVDRVYVIHGVGKGRLRDSIASILMKHSDVKTFKNEYHVRYGFGATEVIFK